MSQDKIDLEWIKNFKHIDPIPDGVKETWNALQKFQQKMNSFQVGCLNPLSMMVEEGTRLSLYLLNLLSCVERTQMSIADFKDALIKDVSSGNSQNLAQYKDDIERTMAAAVEMYTKRLIELSLLSCERDFAEPKAFKILKKSIRNCSLRDIYIALDDGYLGSPQNPHFSQLFADQCYSGTPTASKDSRNLGRKIVDVAEEVRRQVANLEIPNIYETSNSIGVFYYGGIPFSANNRSLCLQSLIEVELPIALILSDAEFRGYVDERIACLKSGKVKVPQFFGKDNVARENCIYLEDKTMVGKQRIIKTPIVRPDRLMPLSQLISIVVVSVVVPAPSLHDAPVQEDHPPKQDALVAHSVDIPSEIEHQPATKGA
jgi:hypothetical protein